MAVRIEDAGFEIRDMIAWVYGSGFPKSLDVSKAIDKQRTEDIEPVRVICRAVRAAMDAKGLKSRDLTRYFDQCHPRLVDHWAARDTDSQPSLPTWEQWQTLRDTLSLGGDHDAEVWRLNGRKGTPGDTWQSAKVIGEHDGATPGFGEHRFSVRDAKIRAASETASRWAGWGTALKPALEPITMARKPFPGTVAANVLEHGTGALNVDGCRVAGPGAMKWETPRGGIWATDSTATAALVPNELGRWPANLIHDGSDEVVGLFPHQAGAAAPASGPAHDDRICAHNSMNKMPGMKGRAPQFHADTGSAARFFYTAKATKAERQGVTHPTVKPLDLMAYLCRLVTPPGGTVLDPFMGSGTTIKAAIGEGFNAIGIERDPAYFAMAEHRMNGAQLGLLLTT
jgi:hypothetical protein